jgi:hypothetical protein
MNNVDLLFEGFKEAIKRGRVPCQVMTEPYSLNNSAARMGINYEKQIGIYLTNNQLGHGDAYIYANGQEVVAVILHDVTNTFLTVQSMFKKLYGVSYKSIRQLSGSSYLFVF